MLTIAYSHLLREVCALAGLAYDDLGTTDWAMLRSLADRRLAMAWEMERWPDLMRVEKRFFRAAWLAGTTYAAGDERYYTPAGKYFQSLRSSNTGNAPATGSDYGTENSAYWAECRTSYSASPWVTGTDYAVGDQVLYGVTGEYYQCHTAHTSSGTLVPDATGGNERWGVLRRFDRYVAWEQSGLTALGRVFRVLSDNPRVTTRTQEYEFEESENGVQVVSPVMSAWLEYRIRRPSLTGDRWDEDAAYGVGAQVFFEDAGVGRFYDCASVTTAGQSPSTHAAKWDEVEVPRLFGGYMARGVYSDWLAQNERAPEAARWNRLAEEVLMIEADAVLRPAGRTQRVRWVA